MLLHSKYAYNINININIIFYFVYFCEIIIIP